MVRGEGDGNVAEVDRELMGKRTGEPKPQKYPLYGLCVTDRYLWLDLSLLYNCPPGIYEVASCIYDGCIQLLFNWIFLEEKLPSEDFHSDKIVRIPYDEWQTYWF